MRKGVMDAGSGRPLRGTAASATSSPARVQQGLQEHRKGLAQLLGKLPSKGVRGIVHGTGWGPTLASVSHQGITLDAQLALASSSSPVFLITGHVAGREQFKLVAKPDAGAAEAVKRHEALKAELPKKLAQRLAGVHGAEKGWLLLEYLQGTEGPSAVATRLSRSTQLPIRMGKDVAELLVSAGKKGFTCFDVDFFAGHNCILDESGRVRLMEQDGLRPSALPAGEDVARFLILELRAVAHALAVKLDPNHLTYALQLTQSVLEQMPESSLINRAAFAPRNARQARMLDSFQGDEKALEALGVLRKTRHGNRNEVLSPQLCEAARKGSLPVFLRMLTILSEPGLAQGRGIPPRLAGIEELSDPADTRAWVRVESRGGKTTLQPPPTVAR